MPVFASIMDAHNGVVRSLSVFCSLSTLIYLHGLTNQSPVVCYLETWIIVLAKHTTYRRAIGETTRNVAAARVKTEEAFEGF